MDDTSKLQEILRKKNGWTLRRELRELELKLKEVQVGSDSYNNIVNAITSIEKIRNERFNVLINVGKAVAMIAVTAVGLGLAYNCGDNGESLPNKATEKFTSRLLGVFWH